MIKRRKKLHDIKSNDTSMTLFELTSSNDMSKVYAGVYCRPLSDAPKLIRIKESISYHMELETIADSFLNKFACHVK